MGCLPWFGSLKQKVGKGEVKVGGDSRKEALVVAQSHPRVGCDKSKSRSGTEPKRESPSPKDGTAHIALQTFTFCELAAATKNFRHDCLLGEGGFGRVYKGRLESTGHAVAVKQLDRNGLQGNREFLVEVLMLSLLHHPNLVNLIGYCADGDQRLLVYEFMPLGSLEDHLHAAALNLPYVPPYLNKSANFDHGVNFAVAGATALNQSFFLEKGINMTTSKYGYYFSHLFHDVHTSPTHSTFSSNGSMTTSRNPCAPQNMIVQRNLRRHSSL